MRKIAFRLAVSSYALALCLALSGSIAARAQEQNPPASTSAEARAARDEINYEAQLHLLMASNEADARASPTPALESAVRQLRTSLPFVNYRLVGAFLCRVRDSGIVEVRGVGNFGLAPTAASPTVPVFYELLLSRLRQSADMSGQPLIHIERFRFGLRLPVTAGSTRAEGSAQSFPVINYEPTGITTEISLREATPTIIGTLSTSRADEVMVLVLTVRRAATR